METVSSTALPSSGPKVTSSSDTGQGELTEDVESFVGKIVYNPDGSAYIIEGSDGSDVESEVGSLVLKEGSIVETAPAPNQPPTTSSSQTTSNNNKNCSGNSSSSCSSSSSVGPIPQVLQAHHISRGSVASLQGSLSQVLQDKVPEEVPIMHSYRVFSLRDQTDKTSQPTTTSSSTNDNEDGDANNNQESSDAEETTPSSSTAGLLGKMALTVPVKPILMCFICKISFGYAKSFVTHATSEHRLTLNDDEERLLGQKNTSAIIQGIGKEKEPLLSFLEPKNKNPQPLLLVETTASSATTTTNTLPTTSSPSSATGSSSHVTGSSSSTTTTAGNNTTNNNQSSLHQQFQQQLMAMAAAQAAAVAALRQGQSQSSSSPFNIPGLSFPETAKESPSRPSSNGSLNLMPKNLEDAFDSDNNKATSDDCSELADLANLEKIAKAAAAAIQQQDVDSVFASLHHQSNTSPTSQSPHASSPKNALLSQLGVNPDGSHAGIQMMHSRNSCKTLKCPKCNWHYKYQETLEIHMKEKHPENEMNCMYCLTNQPHPRLARGETYTCGYKPYRCEVCNYSTTTKGNLSIHMQSDKHINNVQELQNGSLSAALSGVNHLPEGGLHSQAAALLLKSPSVTSNPTGGSSNASSPGATTAVMPPLPASSPKASPVSVPGGLIPPTTPSGSSSQMPGSSSSSKAKATWRCDVCNYETNVARNLRIHLTSEKHSHNMMVLQQNVKHMQQLTALQQAGLLTAGGSGEPMFHPGLFAALAAGASGASVSGNDGLQPEAALADMAYNHALLMMASQHQQQRAMQAVMQNQTRSPNSFAPGLSSPGQPTVDLEHPDPSLRLDAIPYDESCHVLHCCICTTFTCDTIESLSQHIQKDRTRIREDEVLMAVGGSYICKLCQYKTNLKANFQLHCKTDKHLQRLQQVNHIKEGGDRTEWKIKYVNVSNPVQVRCNACDYYTNSIHKLQLHASSPRHETASRVFLHLQLSETIVRSASGSEGKSKVLYYNCAICNHATRSKIALVHHMNTLKHMQHENMRQLKLQQQQTQHGPLPSKTLDEEIREMFQVKELTPGDNSVNFADDARPEAESSLQSPGSRPPSTASSSFDPAASIDSMLKQALQEAHARTMNKSSGEASSTSSSCHSSPIHSCPFCHYTSSSESKIQQHVFNQHSKKSLSSPAKVKKIIEYLCPLCQEAFPEKSVIETHLVDVHSVNSVRVQKLMMMVEHKEVSPNKSHNDNESDDGPTSASAEFEAALLEQQACKFLRLGGGVDAASLPNISDRHVYKYRCHQCSLAFKTPEKLQLHSQYHLIRAATQCVLCSRSFRSLEALQRHMETSHQDMTDGEVETYRQSLLNNPLLGGRGQSSGILDPATTELLRRESNRMETDHDDDNDGETGDDAMDTDEPEHGNTVEDYLNSQTMAENNYNDPDRKYKCHRCKVAFTRQSYLTSHNKTLLHRKGEKMSYPMEKYLDPNRPFKCDICKESFTQKNILLVHYNSVSHLHKLKQEQLKQNRSNSSSSTPVNAIVNNNQHANESSSDSSPDEKKAYKCNICRVSFSLSSTLDIHVRSVLHQTRASKLNELALSGQIDLSLPLIERPESETVSKEQSSRTAASPAARNLEQSLVEQQIQQQLQQQAALNALAVNQQMHQLIAAAAASSGNQAGQPNQGIFPCIRCGAVFTSQEASHQHQQLCCLLSNSMAKSSPNLPLQPKQDLNELNLPSTQHHSHKTLTASEQLAAMRSSSSAINKFFSPSSSSSSTGIMAPSSTFSSYRSKPPVYKHLLETWGFELVMQFNEQHQQRRKKTPTIGKENNLEESPEKDKTNNTENTDLVEETRQNISDEESGVKRKEEEAEESSEENKTISSELPEINRSRCDVCHKEFSSVWVLKAHKEEIHKDIVPLQAVESFAREFKEDFDKKNKNNMSSTFSSSLNTCSVSESASVPAESDINFNAGHNNNDRKSTTAQLPSGDQQHQGGQGSSSTGNMSSPPTANQAPNANDLNAQMAAQIQFSQLLMSMGLGMGMPGMNPAMSAFAAMGIPPQMIPFMMGAQMDPVMAAALQANQATATTPSPTPTSSTPVIPVSGLPSTPDQMFAAQQKLLQQQQLSAAQQQKRARTRITDEQLKILRQYFDINNSPTEDALQEMSEKSGLPLKVIKHWFRNTLFKERQRNKDSPYNFNNPPSTFLNLEEYEKTGETKVVPLEESAKTSQRNDKFDLPAPVSESKLKEVKVEVESPRKESSSESRSSQQQNHDHHRNSTDTKPNLDGQSSSSTAVTSNHAGDQHRSLRDSFDYAKSFSMSPHSESSMSSVSTTASQQHNSVQAAAAAAVNAVSGVNPLFGGNLQAFAAATGIPAGSLGQNPLQMALDAAHRSQAASAGLPQTPTGSSSRDHSSPGSGSAPGKRANRTRFTDYQIKVLQEFFESNAYPKDDDLEYLSKLLGLSPRVIVVWFQNARQKARKVYENQPAVSEDDSNPGRFQRTPGLNYQCKKCMQVFQRYYELIKHQKSACFKDENPLAAQLRAAQDARNAGPSASPPLNHTANSSSSSIAEKNSTPTASSLNAPSTSPAAQSPSSGAFKCEKCGLVFPRFDLWREHQIVHIMNPNLFPSYPPTSPFGILQFEGGNAAASAAALPLSNAGLGQSGVKRKLNDDEDSQESFSGQSTGHQGSQSGQEPQRDKRLRTTILPEQLDYLYQKYQIESNPSRKMLENIAKEVGLKKRVVQVWFQNTRARERKGQFRAHQQVIHKRCPFCRALFKARSALESHLATRHADQYTKGDINIDALPDGDPSEDTAEEKGAVVPNELLQMRQYFDKSHSLIKQYMDGIVSEGNPSENNINNNPASSKAEGMRLPRESPLDLSKPVDLSRGLPFDLPFNVSKFSAHQQHHDTNGYDSRSDNDSDSESDDGEGLHDDSGANSPAPGSTTSSVTSPAAIGGNGQLRTSSNSNSNSANKRFRTQMTTVQLKVMKSIFAEYKTPSMAECETLGREVGLPKRVVQVWFQNARAKEKKAKLAFAKSFGQEMPDNSSKPAEECNVCGVKYNLKFSSTSMQDHLFSRKHIENLKTHIDSVKKGIENPDDSVDFPGASSIVMPSSGDHEEGRQSQSATNLMQQLQLMGLAGSLAGVPGLQAVNGDNNKSNNNNQSKNKESGRGIKSESGDNNSGNGSEGGQDSENNSFAFMFASNPGLHNAYYSAAAGGFLPNAMYGTSDLLSRRSLQKKPRKVSTLVEKVDN